MQETTRRSRHWGRGLHTALPLHVCSAQGKQKVPKAGLLFTSASWAPPSLSWHCCLHMASRGTHSLILWQQMLSGLTGPTLLDGTQGPIEGPSASLAKGGRSLNVRLSSSTRAPGSKDLDVLDTVISTASSEGGVVHEGVGVRELCVPFPGWSVPDATTHLSVRQPHTSPAHIAPSKAPGS